MSVPEPTIPRLKRWQRRELRRQVKTWEFATVMSDVQDAINVRDWETANRLINTYEKRRRK